VTDVNYVADTAFCWDESRLYPDTFMVGYLLFLHTCVGLLFTSVTIPAGATISEAHIRFQNDSRYNSGTCRVYANDTATPSVPTTLAQAEGLVKTTEYVIATPTGVVNDYWNTPDMKAVIQDLVDSYDYSTGGSMMFFTSDPSDNVTWYYRLNSINPTLYITYNVSGGPKMQVIFV